MNESQGEKSTGVASGHAPGLNAENPAPADSASVRPSIELSIEQVVLHGFPAADRHGIGRAMEVELGRLLAEEGAPESFGEGLEIESLNAGEFRAGEGESAQRIGVRIARQVYRSLGR